MKPPGPLFCRASGIWVWSLLTLEERQRKAEELIQMIEDLKKAPHATAAARVSRRGTLKTTTNSSGGSAGNRDYGLDGKAEVGDGNHTVTSADGLRAES